MPPPWASSSSSSSYYFARSFDVGNEVALPIVVGVVITVPIILLLVVMFRQASAEGWTIMKRRRNQKDGRHGQAQGHAQGHAHGMQSKPELSADDSVVIHEMDGRQDPQELPDRPEALPHELPAVHPVHTVHTVPQELPV